MKKVGLMSSDDMRNDPFTISPFEEIEEASVYDYLHHHQDTAGDEYSSGLELKEF